VGKGGKFAQAEFFNRFQQFLDYMSIYLPSSAAVNNWTGNWRVGVNIVTITQGLWPIIGRKLARSTVRRTTSLYELKKMKFKVAFATVKKIGTAFQTGGYALILLSIKAGKKIALSFFYTA